MCQGSDFERDPPKLAVLLLVMPRLPWPKDQPMQLQELLPGLHPQTRRDPPKALSQRERLWPVNTPSEFEERQSAITISRSGFWSQLSYLTSDVWPVIWGRGGGLNFYLSSEML